MRKHKRLRWILLALVAFVIAGAVWPLTVTRYDVSAENVPAAFDGYRILQIADLQNSTDPAILTYAQEAKPDLIVFTGDNFYTTVSEQTMEWTLSLVYQLTKIAPVCMVSGNHDLWNKNFAKNQSLLADAGAILLENATQVIRRGGDSITVSGISDPDTFDMMQAYERVRQCMQKVPATAGYDILLYHRSNMLDIFKGQGYDLIFSGHQHGGQVRLPFGGFGLFSPEGEFFPKYTDGMYQIDTGCVGISSRGIGNTVIFPRVFDSPELVLVTLHKK